ncbi:uncharacterized protein LOC142978019 [Anticarsia gemmatalis]|uniref:uncharacterized protein LOC142978019 n=1 Tax=Anticarsia gemmatalis TaxID=129554 RepID=UPI003F75E51F
MLIFMVFLIFCKVTYVTNKNAGSAIFSSAQLHVKCWSKDDIAKLQARRAFEEIIPSVPNPEKINNRYIKNTHKYLKNAIKLAKSEIDPRTAQILTEALYDTIGGHLKSEILPNVKFSYYAGYIPYKNARQLHDLYEQIKISLNTQGLGWKRPARVPQWSNLTVSKILIGSGKFLDPCHCLVTKRDGNKCIHIPPPRMDDKHEPSAIYLPLKNEELVSLTSPKSENILLKYYTTVSRCILRSSPTNCRHADFVNFNNELWHWMKRDVAPHLADEKLYTAYGGVLRIAAAVQTYGKGLSRRNLFEFQDATVGRWNPWLQLTHSFIHVNTDWTPTLYVSLVVMAAIAICLLQVCYTYVFGEANSCHCKGKPKGSKSQEVAYSKVDSTFPAVFPDHSSIIFSARKRTKRSTMSKTSSVTTVKSKKMSDVNVDKDNIELDDSSSNEYDDEVSTSSKIDTERAQKPEVEASRPKSPPKIETSMAQLTIEKPRSQQSGKKITKPMYSTSTLTRSDATCCREALSDSAWSATSSSSSDKSASSSSSKSHSQRSRSSRDLAWARHVISKHNRRGVDKSSGTEIDGSFATPPTRR